MIGTEPYPCDRGIPNSINRGWHNFQANSRGVICCTLCGARPTPSGADNG